jgi:hypothetical protein
MEGEARPGAHAVRADVSSLPAGVYFCVLRADSRTATTLLVKK